MSRDTFRPVLTGSLALALAVLVGCAAEQASVDPAPTTTTAWDDGVVDRADGVLPDDARVDDDEPGITELDPDLLAALREAAAEAERDGVTIYVTSGWRSPAYQEALLADAVQKYGSEAEAARWVATPETSPHVSGDAVDIGPWDAMSWLSQHGSDFGLCQIYANEPWHYERRPEAEGHQCPAPYDDPTADPRLQ